MSNTAPSRADPVVVFPLGRQLPGEPFKSYESRMLPHPAVASSETVQDLFKLAVVANESLVAEANLQFEALNLVSEQLQQFEQRMTAMHTAANADRYQCSRSNQRRQQRGNGPHFKQARSATPQRQQTTNGRSNGPNNTANQSASRQPCGWCLSNSCQGNPCRAWAVTCNKCGKLNHYARACRSAAPPVTFQ